MQQYRAGEAGRRIPPRSDRFFKLGDDWYFQIRGGNRFGPFSCRDMAQRAVCQMFPRPGHGGATVHPFGSLRARRWRRNHSS
ncbi:DUF6316 family protein [Microbulbifer sp. SAOS-129_SWC]|uniref:DUF6316 family protein n=1 Tax=Microbulbifer sp. SAOS-129_SWC TaxID=3145235 RepID=UPI003216B62B